MFIMGKSISIKDHQRTSWQHSQLIELGKSARVTSPCQVANQVLSDKVSEYQIKVGATSWLPGQQSVTRASTSRPNTDSSLTSQCHGLRHPSRPLFFHSSSFSHRQLEASCSQAYLASFCVFWVCDEEKRRDRLSSKWVPSVTSQRARLLSWGRQQASASSLTWDSPNKQFHLVCG